MRGHVLGALAALWLCAAALEPAGAQTLPSLSPSFPSSAAPRVSPPASRAVAVDPAITARAREWLHRMQTANIDRLQLDARMNGILTKTKIAQIAAALSPLGEPTNFTFLRKLQNKTGTAYVYGATFKAHPAMWLFSLDSAQKINGLVIRPLDAPRAPGAAPSGRPLL